MTVNLTSLTLTKSANFILKISQNSVTKFKIYFTNSEEVKQRRNEFEQWHKRDSTGATEEVVSLRGEDSGARRSGSREEW